MFREIIIPTEKNHIINLPPDLYGKQVEVIAFEITTDKSIAISKKDFLSDIDVITDFPSIENIRQRAWPEK